MINTCGFISSAKEESINTILSMAEHKKDNLKALIVTGCLAQRYKDEILDEMPEIDAIVGTTAFDTIVMLLMMFWPIRVIMSLRTLMQCVVLIQRESLQQEDITHILRLRRAVINGAPIAVFLFSGEATEVRRWNSLWKRRNIWRQAESKN